MKTPTNAMRDANTERQVAFKATLEWIRANGGRFLSRFQVNNHMEFDVYTFAGEVLIVQTISTDDCDNWEFFMPVTSDRTWEGTLNSLKNRLAKSES